MNRAKRGLPSISVLVDEVRKHGPQILDNYQPGIDELTDTFGAAAFYGVKPNTIRRMLGRHRADGSPEMLPPDQRFARSLAWRYRTLVLSKAAAPGQGGSGKFKPGQSGRTRRGT